MLGKSYPVIDMQATGQNILRLRKERGLSVKDVQRWFGFEEPQAVYRWQSGQTLPSVDNLYALSTLLDVPMNDILVQVPYKLNIASFEQQAEPGCSVVFFGLRFHYPTRAYKPDRIGMRMCLGALN